MTQSLACKATLEKSLGDVFSECTIDGLYNCEKCQNKIKAKVRHELVRLPKVLIFHIKRFDSQYHKIKSHCKYPSKVEIKK
jgi:ubiquitin C-terminal hydrolase